ncbi:PQQ-binding-like beta-propeller repeat protein [Gemmatimonadota bacterium]
MKRAIILLAFPFLLLASNWIPQAKQADERCIWSYSVEEISQSLAVVRDIDGDSIPEVAAGDRSGTVTVISGKSGEKVWSNKFGDRVSIRGTISTNNQDYLICNGSGKLFLIAATDGLVIWNQANAMGAIEPIPDTNGDGWDDICSGGVDNGRIYCLSGADGSTIWTISLDDHIARSITFAGSSGDEEVVIAVGTRIWGYTGGIFLLNGSDGETIWFHDLNGTVMNAAFSNMEERIFLRVKTGPGADKVVGIQIDSGTVSWERDIGHLWNILAISDVNGDGRGDVLVPVWTEGGPVYALDAQDGSTIWECSIDPAVRPEPMISVGNIDQDGVDEIAVGTGYTRGIVHLINGRNGWPVWSFKASDDVQSDISRFCIPGDLNGDQIPDIVAASYDKNIYALSGHLSK